MEKLACNPIQFRMHELLSLMVITVSGFVLSVVIQFPLIVGFLPGLTYLMIMIYRKGVLFFDLIKASRKGIKRNKEVIWLLGLIAIILPAWMMSGTIPRLIELTLSWIKVDHFILLSFLITFLVSMMLGTAIGSLSVIGIPLIGAAQTIGVPLEWTAGALVSGAFVGDRTSPLSSAHQLLAHTLEISPRQQFSKMVPTLLIGTIVCCIFYSLLDTLIDPASIDQSLPRNQDLLSLPISSQLKEWSRFLPPIILLSGVIFRMKIRYSFMLSFATAMLIAFIDDVTLTLFLHSMWYGVNGIGGLNQMLLLMLFIALVGIYNELLEEWKVLQPLFVRILTNTHSMKTNTLQTLGITFVVSLLAPNQSLPIILTGRALLPHWKRYFNVGDLARILGDTTMLFAGLVPWCMLAIMCATITHVPVIHYMPFAAFLWIMPLVTVIYSFFGKEKITVSKKSFF